MQATYGVLDPLSPVVRTCACRFENFLARHKAEGDSWRIDLQTQLVLTYPPYNFFDAPHGKI